MPVTILLVWLAIFSSCVLPPEARFENPSDPLSPTYYPLGPEKLSITIGSDELFSLRWSDRSIGEQGFRLFRKAESDTGFTLLATLPADSCTFSDADPKRADVGYSYRLYSYANQHLSTSYSEGSARFTVPAPLNVASVGTDSTRVKLSWKHAVSFPTAYVIERKSLGEFDTLALLPSGVSSFADSSVDKYHIYWYRITARTHHNASAGAVVRCAYGAIDLTAISGFQTFSTHNAGKVGTLSDDLSLFVSVSFDQATLVGFPSGTPIRVITFPRIVSYPNAGALSRNKQVLAFTGWHDSAAFVYGVQDGLLKRTIHGPWPAVDVALTDDGSRVVGSFGEGIVKCLNVSDGALIWERNLASTYTTLWLPPGGSSVLVGNSDGCAFLDLNTGTTVSTSIGNEFVRTPLVTSTGDILISSRGLCINVTQNRVEFAGIVTAGSCWLSRDRLFMAVAYNNEYSHIMNVLTGTSIPMGMYLAGWHEYTRLFEEDQKVLVYNEWGDVNIWKIKYGWYQF